MAEKKKDGVRRIFGVRIDIVVVAALLLVALVWVGAVLLSREAGEFVEVEVGGVVVGRYSLSGEGEYVLGGGKNILVIKDGAAHMRYADCPDKTCVNVGKISFVGETIVCLPNGVTVTVVGSGGADFVS